MILQDMKLPYWMDVLWEEAEKRTTKFLRLYSEDYKRLKTEKNKILNEEPELAAVIEGDAREKELRLDSDKVKKLSELFVISTDILWLYEKMFYAYGVLDGIKIADLLYRMNEISE